MKRLCLTRLKLIKIKNENEKNDDESIENGDESYESIDLIAIENVNGDESYESFDLIAIENVNGDEIEIEIDTACGFDTHYDVYRRCFDDAQQRADLKK